MLSPFPFPNSKNKGRKFYSFFIIIIIIIASTEFYNTCLPLTVPSRAEVAGGGTNV